MLTADVLSEEEESTGHQDQVDRFERSSRGVTLETVRRDLGG